MHRPYIVQMRRFRCEECGVVVTAPKKVSRKTSAGHVKHMYCYKCQKTTRHIQIS